jgi:PTS system fructose-specific IIA component
MSSNGSLSIAHLLTPETVRVKMPGGTKDDVLNAVIDLLEGAEGVVDLAQVRRDVFAREQQMSTGVGMGLALPHARTSAVADTVAAFATTADGVPFAAHDGQPVSMIFLLVGLEGERSRHIRLLGRISRLMNRDAFRQRLLAATTSAEALTLFRDADAEFAA